MPQLKVIYTAVQTTGSINTTAYGAAVPLDGASTYSAQCAVTVDTPGAKTFLSGVAASKVVQDLTYTAVTRGTAGNSITVTYTGGGTAGAEVVTVVGSGISVQIQSGTSTATQVRTAVLASGAAAALVGVTVSGTGSNAQTTVSAQSLAGGIASAVNTSNEQITIASHGYTTGLKGQASSTSTLPAGLSTSTDYFVIVIDSNTIQLASSLANALAGTPVNLTDQGTSGATNTFTPTAIAGAVISLQTSNSDSSLAIWSDVVGSAVAVTATTNAFLEKIDPSSNWMRIKYTLTAGSMSVSSNIVVKGLN